MKNNTTCFLMFVAGATIGSVATWQYTKKRYEQIAQEEIDSVKEVFSKREPCDTQNADVREKAAQAKEKPGVMEYAARLHDEGYTNYSKVSAGSEKERRSEPVNKPYVITPEEFGDFDEYDKISITYYADHILADDNDEVIDDVDSVVGSGSLERFGEYEEDSVFVRNDMLKCDYEILRDQRKYSDVALKPHQVEE